MQPDLGLVWKFKNIEVFQEFHVKNTGVVYKEFAET